MIAYVTLERGGGGGGAGINSLGLVQQRENREKKL